MKYYVLTCLECGKRKFLEYNVLKTTKCECGSQEIVVTGTQYYANAKRLAALPLRNEFRLIHKALRSKLKVIELLKEMIETCNAEVAKAEIANDVKTLKSVAKWLMAIEITGLKQEQAETKECIIPAHDY
jgi:hypothetical protein